eukprot:TRINITY_DN27600_c0_g1_i1.p1 TRINITY_DN27600_c0_g1~~TRINITY_DN27600_c0_g1_i1.p1  ORF type:complete len:418 (+),score=176.49 TRINITY_DN27600_c0_g1_i1:48-1256(+)
MVPLAHWHVSDDGIAGLKNYKYSGTDLSLTSKYIMQRWWKYATTFLPRTMAPNLVTLCGFGLLLTSYFVIAAHSAECRAMDVPRWVWVLFCLCLFGYQTFDAMDGKQARRTGSSSPLGELFDHGCDAIGTYMISLNTMAVLAVPREEFEWALLYVVVMSMGFYLCAWEQYHTGTLTLGYVNGPVEGILTNCAIILMAALHGSGFYHEVYYGFPLWKIAIGGTMGLGVATFANNFFSVYTKNAAGGTKIHPALTLAPLPTMVGSIVLLTHVYPDYMYGQGFRVVCCTFGLAVALLCGKFVIARVCCSIDKVGGLKTPMLGFPVAALVYGVAPRFLDAAAAAELQATLPTFFQTYMYILCATYLHLSLSVCKRITEALGINTLSLTSAQVKRALELKAEEEKQQ